MCRNNVKKKRKKKKKMWIELESGVSYKKRSHWEKKKIEEKSIENVEYNQHSFETQCILRD